MTQSSPKRLRIWMIAGFVVILGISGVWASYQGYFELLHKRILDTSARAGFAADNVEIYGNYYTKRKIIEKIVISEDKMPIFGLDLGALRNELEKLPWVRRAKLARSLPSSLLVTIEEHRPFGLWQHSGRLDLISDDGTVIPGADIVQFAELGLYVGDGANTEAARLVKAFQKYPELYGQMKSAVRVGRRRWDIVFKGGVRVKFPEDGFKNTSALNGGFQNELDKAMERFARLEKEYRLLRRDITVVDLRLDDKLIIRVSPDARDNINTDLHST